MKISGKAKLEINQLLDRKQRGSNAIEVFTDIDTFKHNINYENINNVLQKIKLNVYAIHSPMKDEEGYRIGAGILDQVKRKNSVDLFKKSIRLANEICDVKNPIVIIHADGLYNIDKYNPHTAQENKEASLKCFVEDLRYLNEFTKQNYPNIILGIENISAFNYLLDKTYGTYYGSGLELPTIIESLNLSNIKTVLDICHAQSVCNLDIIQNVKNNRTIETYINAFAKTLCLVHLNNVKSFGEAKGKHGAPFTNNKIDTMYLDRIIKTLEKNNYKGPITAEICEEDINAAINLETTFNTLKQLGYEKYIN